MGNPKLPPLPERPEDAHKGICGRVLVIAGSLGMTGAGALASEAALRSGAGLVTWAIPECIAQTAEIKCTEVITWPIPCSESGHPSLESRELLDEASMEVDAVILGPGLPAVGETGELMRLLIAEIHAPLVLDAGALSALEGDLGPLMKRRRPTVLTPHPGELARMTGKRIDEIQAARGAIAMEFAKSTGTITLLKGAGTVITDGEQVAINKTGNPGMATAGSGDVLAGVIAAFLGQKVEPFDAAVLAAHLHGLAGDIAVKTTGVHSLIAGDILKAIPAAFLQYQKTD
ncbi:MAG: NAD(P)H-hydrate dehydratase [Planctomycetes bacterium]|nr:NAD(P)H-hydrate dehydratase [Planctomycetota bacterium]